MSMTRALRAATAARRATILPQRWSVLLVAQLVASPPALAQSGAAVSDTADVDSLYASPALRALVAAAAAQNQVPAEVRSYRAQVETEIGIISRRPDGTEGVAAVEQVASTVRWSRQEGDRFEQRVTGYRSQQIGPNISMLSMLPAGWITPTLYGDRLRIQALTDSSTGGSGRGGARRSGSAQGIRFIHPLAADRDAAYRYTGGDTVMRFTLGGRDIPVVRVHVEPRRSSAGRAGVFSGDVDLDATRHQVVRMRGRIAVVGGRRRWRERVPGARIQAAAYVEYVNAEFDGRVWLPSFQRLELQAAFPMLGEGRAVLRLVSRLRQHEINAGADEEDGHPPGDGARGARWRLTYAPGDSIEGYDGWRSELGSTTAGSHANDFDDVAPDAWRAVGRPRLDLQPERGSDIFHFNRVEGAYTGLAATLRLRDAAPGLVLRAAGGWGWSERAARGRVQAEWLRGRWLLGARASRALAITNDFRSPFDSGSTIAALLVSSDDYDYVDRRSAMLSVGRLIGGRRGALLRVEVGLGSDRGVSAHVRRGLFAPDSSFRPNRGVDDGRYRRAAVTLEYHPDVTAELMRPGFGALTSYERGSGELDWQRAEARLVGRHNLGRLTYAARLDAGVVVSGAPPPQQLFEIGQNQNLPGYDYKEFAGDRAAVARLLAMYATPYLTSPLRLGRWVLPSVSPALTAGVQAGWAEASDRAALASIARLGVQSTPEGDGPVGGAPAAATPVSRPSAGVRASVNAGVRFFGGSLFVGAARPVSEGGRWRFQLAFAQQL
jgi:hypothetical protein